MNPLALIATGLYGKDLLPQNGARCAGDAVEIRLQKSIKSIVKIDLGRGTAHIAVDGCRTAQEYGFYANVNPEVQHPRWSQRTERING